VRCKTYYDRSVSEEFNFYIKSCLTFCTIKSLIIPVRVSHYFLFINMAYIVFSSRMNFANLLCNGSRENAFLFQRETLSIDFSL